MTDEDRAQDDANRHNPGGLRAVQIARREVREAERPRWLERDNERQN